MPRSHQHASTSTDSAVRSPFELAPLLPLLALALALRLPGLTRSELWFDEAASWWFGRLVSSGGLMETLALEPTPPLYYAFLGGVARLFGDGEIALRLPSVLLGALSIVPLYLLAAELFDRRVAIWSSGLLAIHPLHVFYSREARVYPWLTLLVPLAVWLAVRTAQTANGRAALGLGLSLVLLCYSHMYALFVVPLCLVVGLLFVPASPASGIPSRRNVWLLVVATVGATLLWLPYLLYTVPLLSESGAAWSVSVFYEQNPEQKNLLRSFAQLLFGANYHGDLRQLSFRRVADWLWLPAMVLQGALVGLAVVRGLARGKRRSLLALGLGWPLLIVPPWLLTLLGRPMYLPGRHDALCLGFVCCWLAIGIVELLDRRRAAARAQRRGFNALRLFAIPALLFLGLLAVQRLIWIHIEQPASYHRSTAAHLAESVQSGDVVIATGIRRLVTQYYLSRSLRDGPLDVLSWREGEILPSTGVLFVSYPRSTDQHPGWSDALTLIEDEAALRSGAQALVASLESSSTGTVWTLERTYTQTEDAVSVAYLVDRHLFEALLEGDYAVVGTAQQADVRRWQR